MILAIDWMKFLSSSLYITNIYVISCDTLQADDVAVGQILLDIAYQLQEKEGCTHCCPFVFCVAFFFV